MLIKTGSVFILGLMLLSSCKGEKKPNEKLQENTELVRLKGEVRSLKLEKTNKDSLLNESIYTFNEIQNNLARIGNKENEIRLKTEDVSLSPDNKKWILQEIRNINFLREENSLKIKKLNQQLQSKNLAINELQTMVNRLSLQVQSQDEQINSLQKELASLDGEYAKLFDAYQEQTILTFETLKELNKSFYTYGSLKELKANNVIIQDGGFIGIGENTLLKDGFNEKYFTEIDRKKTKTITVIARKMHFVTDHPSSSYTILDKGNSKVIQIKNPDAFWKISRYLVIVTN
ncbi:MAG: hypothetical protein ABI207_06320 [Crocinitomicaceae bacterium]